MEPDGRLVAEIKGLQLKLVDSEFVFNRINQKQPFEDLLYQIEWREQDIIENIKNKYSSPDYLLSPQAIGEQIIPVLPEQINQPEIIAYRQLLPKLENLSIAYVLKAFDDLGWNFVVDESFLTKEIIEKLKISSQHERLLQRLLSMLVEVDILNQEDKQWKIVQKPIIPQPEIQYQQLLEKCSIGKNELSLLHRCGSSLAQVLRGEIDGVQLLFPEGDLSTATNLYQDSPGAKLMNRLIEQVVSTSISEKSSARVLRILEIGAGTGGTTAYLLPSLDSV